MFIPLHDANALKHIRLQYVTLAIIAINVGFWLITGTPAILSPEAKQASFVAYGFIPVVGLGSEVLPAELHRIPTSLTYLSYSFFHADFMHLAGNMLFIWVFGDNIEDAVGHFRFVVFYALCAAVAALAHGMAVPGSSVPLIGASGAAAGIVGAYLLLHPKIQIWVLALGRIPLRIPAVIVLGLWALWQVYMFLTDVDGNVSWAAHVGGLIAGIVLILFMRRPGVELFDRNVNVVIPASDASAADIDVVDGAGTADPARPHAPAPKQGRPSRGSVPSTGKPARKRWGRDAQ